MKKITLIILTFIISVSIYSQQIVFEKTLGKEKVLLDTFEYAKKNNKNVHLLGLVSNGGIHAHIDHLKGLLDVANERALGSLGSDFFASSIQTLNNSMGSSRSKKQLLRPSEFFSFII